MPTRSPLPNAAVRWCRPAWCVSAPAVPVLVGTAEGASPNAGRDSSGVRGVKLLNSDEVISLSVLRHVEATPEERVAYLKQANARRRTNGSGEAEIDSAVARGSARFSAIRTSHLLALVFLGVLRTIVTIVIIQVVNIIPGLCQFRSSATRAGHVGGGVAITVSRPVGVASEGLLAKSLNMRWTTYQENKLKADANPALVGSRVLAARQIACR